MGVVVMIVYIGLSALLSGFILGVVFCAQINKNYFKEGYKRGYLDAQYGVPNQVDGNRKQEGGGQ